MVDDNQRLNHAIQWNIDPNDFIQFNPNEFQLNPIPELDEEEINYFAEVPMDAVSFRLSGNQIFQVHEQTNYGATLADFLQELKSVLVNNAARPSELLPRGCRFFVDDGFTRRYVMEVPPTIAPFKWDDFYIENDDIEISADIVEVSLPWQYFVFTVDQTPENPFDVQGVFTNSQLFWTATRVTSIADRIHIAQLPNINLGNAQICLGVATPDSQGLVADRIEQIVGDFYSSTFNGDLGWSSSIPYGDPYVWRDASKANPLHWMDYKMPTIRERFSVWLGVNNRAHGLNERRYASNLIHDAMYRASQRSEQNG